MSQSFASISALIDCLIEQEVHNRDKSKFSLYLTTSSDEPIHFFDISKVRFNFPQDDLETYLHSNPRIAMGSTVCLENCDVNLEYGKENDIISCEIQTKKVIIEVGTENEKKLKDCKIRLQVESETGQIPLLPSTRRYIRRIKKQEAVRKEKPSKVDILAFIPKGSAKEKNQFDPDSELLSEIGPLDTDSIKILQKLTHFIDKNDLFSIVASKPLKHKTSKKAVRLMVIPNDQTSNNPMKLKKKNYRREEVQQLHRQYQSKQ